MESTFRSPFSYGISNSSEVLPRNGLLIYLDWPNTEEHPLGFKLPNDLDIRAATGWEPGVANTFYDADGVPTAALATDIAASDGINEWNILFLLVDANNQTGILAIYDPNTALSVINKARRYMHLPASTALAVDDSVVLVNDDVLTVV